MLKFLASKRLPFLLVFVFLVPAVIPLFKPGYFNMHDDMQMIRQLEMEKCLLDGQIPCRWTPDLGYGYGYPLFNFYPPLPYIVGQFFRLLGFSFVVSVKLTVFTQFTLSSVFMYLLASSISGPLSGLLASVFYTYAPYHALNVYVRGAMNEAWASVFFPLIFYFSRLLILKKKLLHFLLLSLSLSFLLLSHNPMALTFLPFFGLWCIYWLIKDGQANFISSSLKLFFAGIFSICLSAYFTLPVLLETKYVQIESMFQNYYHFSVHFTSLFQLFISNFWGEGASVWGQDDQMSFMIGYLHWLLPLSICILNLFFFLKSKKKNLLSLLPFFLAASGFFAAFMTHERSTFLWQLLTPIQKIQFPWRFLNHSVFLLSLSSALLPSLIEKNFKLLPQKVVYPLVFIVFLLNISYFRPITSGPLSDEEKFSGKAWTNQVTSGIYDYLPKTASKAPQSPANKYIDQIIPSENKYELSGQKQGSDWLLFNLKLDRQSQIILPILAFPNFEIKDNQQTVSYTIEPEFGRIVLDLTPGDHQIYAKFRNTPIRTAGNIISLISWLLCIGVFIRPIWNKNTSNK